MTLADPCMRSIGNLCSVRELRPAIDRNHDLVDDGPCEPSLHHR